MERKDQFFKNFKKIAKINLKPPKTSHSDSSININILESPDKGNSDLKKVYFFFKKKCLVNSVNKKKITNFNKKIANINIKRSKKQLSMHEDVFQDILV